MYPAFDLLLTHFHLLQRMLRKFAPAAVQLLHTDTGLRTAAYSCGHCKLLFFQGKGQLNWALSFFTVASCPLAVFCKLP